KSASVTEPSLIFAMTPESVTDHTLASYLSTQVVPTSIESAGQVLGKAGPAGPVSPLSPLTPCSPWGPMGPWTFQLSGDSLFLQLPAVATIRTAPVVLVTQA